MIGDRALDVLLAMWRVGKDRTAHWRMALGTEVEAVIGIVGAVAGADISVACT
jgi:hypothetical protein